MSTLSIGFARELYSPDTPQPQNSSRTGYSVLTDIMVTCICLSDGDQKALIFSNDIRNLSPDFVEAYIKTVEESTGLDRSRILVTTTHNHSAPDISYYKRNESVTDWVERICFPAVIECAKKAMEDLSPVTRVTSGKSHVENVTFVRRYLREDGAFSGIQMPKMSDAPLKCHETEADTELRALRFYREGKKDVVLTNFQVHAATALGASKDMICSDFLHEFRRVTEESGEFSVIYLQGGCGNLNTFSKIYPEACNKDYDRVGRLLGEGLLDALQNEEERNFDGLVIKQEFYTGIVDHTRDGLLEKAKEAIEESRKQTFENSTEEFNFFWEKGFTSRLDAGAVISKHSMEKTRQIPLSTVCFGDVGMTFAPFEMFDTNCVQIRAASPFKMTFTVGYTNFRHHYLPTAYSFSNGGYESLQCYYIPGTGECVSLEFLRQLKESFDTLSEK